jgi:hypothetical protein
MADAAQCRAGDDNTNAAAAAAAAHSASSDDPDPADVFDPALFTAVEYVPTTLTAGARHTLTLSVSAAASTDYDLTGQALWPAAQLLADFLTAAGGAGPAAVQAAPALIELGAGVGFTGLAAAAEASGAPEPTVIVLTDGEPEVVKVLARNAAAFLAEEGRPHPPPLITAAVLRWGDPPAADALVAAHCPGGFPLVIGADVTYSLAALPALFSTAARLSASPGGRFLLGYVSRSAALDRGVLEAARQAGWAGKEVDGTRRTMPCGTMEGWVIDFRLEE